MEYTLAHTLHFRGKAYEKVVISDYFKTRHKLALAENMKKTESQQHEALVMSFCENLPADSFGDVAADDMDFIADYVNGIMTKYAESHGMLEAKTGKKKRVSHPRHPVIQPTL